MLIDASFRCAFCGETVWTSADPSQGSGHRYVEDCQVCCQPNLLVVTLDGRGGAHIEAEPE